MAESIKRERKVEMVEKVIDEGGVTLELSQKEAQTLRIFLGSSLGTFTQPELLGIYRAIAKYTDLFYDKPEWLLRPAEVR